MIIEVLKCHGSGNDFIIIDEMNEGNRLSEKELVVLTKQLAARDQTIGSDGTLFIQDSDHADAKMRMFNTDGSEAEMCGNGLRCVARYVTEKVGEEQVIIETMKANLNVLKVDEIYSGIPTYEVTIEPVSFKPDTLPFVSELGEHMDETILSLDPRLRFTALSVPNPHIVTVVEQLNESEVEQIGELANQRKDIFPNGVNVSFLKNLGKGRIFVQTYERGVGLTNACGTAMSASSLVSCLLGLNQVNDEILVLNRGGMVQCIVNNDVHGRYSIGLRGNATYEFSATVEIDFSAPEQAELLEQTIYEDEIANYQRLAEAAKKMV